MDDMRPVDFLIWLLCFVSFMYVLLRVVLWVVA